ncbi:hypothetical protein LVD17_12470 [Fulvivirga ulvae]|uniref:hypothetical protein n=1 Tax=Fulvivirga ulvae TaxID=2904245 RepID=UPI001F1BAA17|nr:hypothetical protein [Fulvivirga ulvae]UII34622.1 hypothetical protein LVD17_12470 [Fulvivirga ulvae]
MKKKKLILKELKVTSLVTSFTPMGKEAETVKGGAQIPRSTVCTVTNALACHTSPIHCDFATANTCTQTHFPLCLPLDLG